MKRTAMLVCALQLSLGCSGVLLSASAEADNRSTTRNVLLRSERSVAQIARYVDEVDRRLQKGRYDDVAADQQSWLIDQIAGLRDALKSADVGGPPSTVLRDMAGEFETGVIGIEEGGIVCSRERPTGSHRIAQKCRTQKHIDEERTASQDGLRQLKRPQGLYKQEPVVGGSD